MKKKAIMLVLILLTCCFVYYFFYMNLNSRRYLAPNEAKQIIFSVKEFIVNGFKKNNEHGERFLQASYELGTDWLGRDILFVRGNFFTVKYSHWLFWVKGDIGNGVYIDENYIGSVTLEKSKNSWEVKDGGIFKREIYKDEADNQLAWPKPRSSWSSATKAKEITPARGLSTLIR